jgi:CHAT domain-containing protein
MPDTPDAAALPGAAEEAKLVLGLVGERAHLLEGPAATHDAVLAGLPGARWAHFACHGLSDLRDPSAGRLLLHDHRAEPLTVLDVMRLHLEDAELAFLSACETARAGVQLPDESVHLASAFQLAGFRHVIATLWPIGDRPAVRVAAGVYTALTRDGEARAAAAALHAAIRQMRAVLPEQPSVWAAYTHSGA